MIPSSRKSSDSSQTLGLHPFPPSSLCPPPLLRETYHTTFICLCPCLLPLRDSFHYRDDESDISSNHRAWAYFNNSIYIRIQWNKTWGIWRHAFSLSLFYSHYSFHWSLFVRRELNTNVWQAETLSSSCRWMPVFREWSPLHPYCFLVRKNHLPCLAWEAASSFFQI